MMRGWVVVIGLLISSKVASQEIKCTQVFMNKTEKAICASAEIMALDTKMSTVAHRAELIDENYRSDQKHFRKELKTCESATECLKSKYSARITYLEATISSGAPLTQDQENTATSKDTKAQIKLDKQALARQKYAEQASKNQNQTQSLADNENSNDASSTQQILKQDIRNETAQSTDLPAQGTETTQAINSASDKDTKKEQGAYWIIITIIIIISLIFLSIILSIWTWIKAIVRRCPRCTKWWAAEAIDSTSNTTTEYELRKFDDIHKDHNRIERGRTTRTQQVAVNVTQTSTLYHCKICEHEWTIHSSSRS